MTRGRSRATCGDADPVRLSSARPTAAIAPASPAPRASRRACAGTPPARAPSTTRWSHESVSVMAGCTAGLAADRQHTIGDATDGEDRRLRRVDDRAERVDAVHAEVADRERAALDVAGRERPLAGRPTSVSRRARCGRVERVGVVDHRDDQPVVEGDGQPDADLGVATMPAVAPRAVERGMVAKRAATARTSRSVNVTCAPVRSRARCLPAEQPARVDLALEREVRGRVQLASVRSAIVRQARLTAAIVGSATAGAAARLSGARRVDDTDVVCLNRPAEVGARGRRDRRPPRAPSRRASGEAAGCEQAPAARRGLRRTSPGARISAITLPTGTRRRPARVTPASVPSAGASISTMTLSVSISISGSPFDRVALRLEPAHDACPCPGPCRAPA